MYRYGRLSLVVLCSVLTSNQMASELVRTKVTNQQLADENESLKMQVAELQTIIQAQPGEVENRLRHEMDRIMKRNIEVQNENRALEESCTEMEGELIKAKLSHAEVSTFLFPVAQDVFFHWKISLIKYRL